MLTIINMDIAAENQRLREEIAQLRQRNKELEALLGQDSHNSNWPSSRDKSRTKKGSRSLRAKSGKKAGGQEGHSGHTLEMSAKPDHTERYRPREQFIPYDRSRQFLADLFEVHLSPGTVANVVGRAAGRAAGGAGPERGF
ncbi:MAG: DUF6444 domain-containing protein [Chloroflexi bacterium]|nr:DUF6444 domain-containing protein [Chloroflexota bacterium]